MAEDPTLDEYRTGYISERWDVSDNCARALQLFELNFSHSAIAKALSVQESTVKSYKRQISEEIGEMALLSPNRRPGKFDVWGERSAEDYETYGYEDGVAHAQERESAPATTEQSQIDLEFLDREKPLARGSIDGVSKDLIDIDTNVEVYR